MKRCCCCLKQDSRLLLILLMLTFTVASVPDRLFAQRSAAPLAVVDKPLAGAFPLVNNRTAAPVYIDSGEARVISIAAEAFKNDVSLVTGCAPAIKKDSIINAAFPVIVGTIGQSKLINHLVKTGKLDVAKVKGNWETFLISVIENPFPTVQRALVIAGSDRRGTAFGVFELSGMIGVSPWYWWADVHPLKKSSLYVTAGTSITGPPSVQYRGIFINDEKWGLQAWAAKHADSAYKNIAANTYAKVFELLLRLKANYLWPAMYYGTKAFYYYPDNPKVADDYAIVIGSSHCEQMLRNNIFEWAVNYEAEYKEKPGPWRYDLNKGQIYKYWDDRVKQTSMYESTYMIGMRGISDSEMPGPDSQEEKIALWNRIVADQRGMLEKHTGKPASDVLQTFCPYNEVLDMYRTGKLNLPEDVNMIWVDDNHGYVRQLPTISEQKRKGGNGMYYHFSYLGQPESFLWLSSVSPALTSYEMTKSYNYGASRLWIFNVGDIKPAEMELAFAMELAWDINSWPPEKAHLFPRYWAAKIFGDELGAAIAAIKREYYELAASGKPEQVNNIEFSDNEISVRLARYAQLAAKAASLGRKVPERLKDAYFQLVQYPALGAYLMNKKSLYAKQSRELANAGNARFAEYARLARVAHDSVLAITHYYNKVMAAGKWDAMMSLTALEVKTRFHDMSAPVVGTDSAYQAARRGAAGSKKNGTGFHRIHAASYTKKEDVAGHAIRTIEGLGITGKGVTIMPLTASSIKGNTVKNAPYVEYRMPLQPGRRQISVKCLPTHAINPDHGLRYAISVNGELPLYVNLEGLGEHWSHSWGTNVKRGYMYGETMHTIKTAGATVIRIYLLDPGLVLSAIDVL